MKSKTPLLDRCQDYKFSNLHYVKGVNHIWHDKAFMSVLRSAFAVYCEGSTSSIPTLDDRFCDHFAKKCNGKDRAIAIESIKLLAALTHKELKPIRAHYSIDNETILRAINGRPKQGKASVGDKQTQAAQADNLLNDLRKLCHVAQSRVDYIGGKLSATDTSKAFLETKKVIITANNSLNDSRELKLLNDAHRINKGVDEGVYDGMGALIPKKDRQAPKTAPKPAVKTA